MTRQFCSGERAAGPDVRRSSTSARTVIADIVIAATSVGARPASNNNVAPTDVINEAPKASSITATGNAGIGSGSSRQRRA